MRTVRRTAAAVLAITLIAACGSTRSSKPRPRSSTTSAPPVTTTVPVTTAPLAPEQWSAIPDSPIFLGSYAVWTGSEYIGGTAGCCDGLDEKQVVAYSPAAHRWRYLAPYPLLPRGFERAVWTGHEMIVAGGVQAGSATDTSVRNAVPTTTVAALDPVANRWRTLAPMPATIRYPDGAVWTGSEVLLFDATRVLLYNPVTNTWRAGAAPPFDRGGVTVVWTGHEMIIWGGSTQANVDAKTVVYADGAAYDPAANRWRMVPRAPVPARTASRAVWTGTEMILWGGDRATGPAADALVGQGAAYDPATNTWRALPTSPMKARTGHEMVWTGREVVVWGGSTRMTRPDDTTSSYPRDGAAYNPLTNTWRSLVPSPQSPPAMLTAYSSVWTGDTALFIGGSSRNLQAVGPQGLAYTPGR